MDRPRPVVIAARLAVGRLAVDFVDAVVPHQLVGGEVVLPDADARGFQRQLQAPGQAPQLGVVLLPFAEQPPGHQDRQHHQRAGEQP